MAVTKGDGIIKSGGNKQRNKRTMGSRKVTAGTEPHSSKDNKDDGCGGGDGDGADCGGDDDEQDDEREDEFGNMPDHKGLGGTKGTTGHAALRKSTLLQVPDVTASMRFVAPGSETATASAAAAVLGDSIHTHGLLPSGATLTEKISCKDTGKGKDKKKPTMRGTRGTRVRAKNTVVSTTQSLLPSSDGEKDDREGEDDGEGNEVARGRARTETCESDASSDEKEDGISAAVAVDILTEHAKPNPAAAARGKQFGTSSKKPSFLRNSRAAAAGGGTSTAAAAAEESLNGTSVQENAAARDKNDSSAKPELIREKAGEWEEGDDIVANIGKSSRYFLRKLDQEQQKQKLKRRDSAAQAVLVSLRLGFKASPTAAAATATATATAAATIATGGAEGTGGRALVGERHNPLLHGHRRLTVKLNPQAKQRCLLNSLPSSGTDSSIRDYGAFAADETQQQHQHIQHQQQPYNASPLRLKTHHRNPHSRSHQHQHPHPPGDSSTMEQLERERETPTLQGYLLNSDGRDVSGRGSRGGGGGADQGSALDLGSLGYSMTTIGTDLEGAPSELSLPSTLLPVVDSGSFIGGGAQNNQRLYMPVAPASGTAAPSLPAATATSEREGGRIGGMSTPIIRSSSRSVKAGSVKAAAAGNPNKNSTQQYGEQPSQLLAGAHQPQLQLQPGYSSKGPGSHATIIPSVPAGTTVTSNRALKGGRGKMSRKFSAAAAAAFTPAAPASSEEEREKGGGGYGYGVGVGVSAQSSSTSVPASSSYDSVTGASTVITEGTGAVTGAQSSVDSDGKPKVVVDCAVVLQESQVVIGKCGGGGGGGGGRGGGGRRIKADVCAMRDCCGCMCVFVAYIKLYGHATVFYQSRKKCNSGNCVQSSLDCREINGIVIFASMYLS